MMQIPKSQWASYAVKKIKEKKRVTYQNSQVKPYFRNNFSLGMHADQYNFYSNLNLIKTAQVIFRSSSWLLRHFVIQYK